MTKNVRFQIISRRPIGLNKEIAGSYRSDGKYSLARLYKVPTDEGSEDVFQKESLIVDSTSLFPLFQVLAELILSRTDASEDQKEIASHVLTS